MEAQKLARFVGCVFPFPFLGGIFWFQKPLIFGVSVVFFFFHPFVQLVGVQPPNWLMICPSKVDHLSCECRLVKDPRD